MYFELFRASVQAAQLLQAAQQQAEKQLLEADLPPIRLEQKEDEKYANSFRHRCAMPPPSMREALALRQSFVSSPEAPSPRELARRMP